MEDSPSRPRAEPHTPPRWRYCSARWHSRASIPIPERDDTDLADVSRPQELCAQLHSGKAIVKGNWKLSRAQRSPPFTNCEAFRQHGSLASLDRRLSRTSSRYHQWLSFRYDRGHGRGCQHKISTKMAKQLKLDT